MLSLAGLWLPGDGGGPVTIQFSLGNFEDGQRFTRGAVTGGGAGQPAGQTVEVGDSGQGIAQSLTTNEERTIIALLGHRSRRRLLTQLQSPAHLHHGGAGVGLNEMIRKSLGQVYVEFISVNSDHRHVIFLTKLELT